MLRSDIFLPVKNDSIAEVAIPVVVENGVQSIVEEKQLDPSVVEEKLELTSSEQVDADTEAAVEAPTSTIVSESELAKLQGLQKEERYAL